MVILASPVGGETANAYFEQGAAPTLSLSNKASKDTNTVPEYRPVRQLNVHPRGPRSTWSRRPQL